MANPEAQTSKTPENDENKEIVSISSRISIPILHSDQIDTWFLQLESWFTLNGIKSEATKFNTVVASLDAKIINQIFSIVKTPPNNDQYSVIKNAVIAAYADTSQQRFQKLFSGIQLGDRRPSHLLNDLRKVGDTIDENMLKNLWLSHLPTQAKTIVAAAKGNLNELAIVADAVVDSLELTLINETSSSSIIGTSNQNSHLTLIEKISELSKQIQHLSSVNSAYNSRSRSKSRDKKTNRRDITPKNKSTTCWYHRVYGTTAKKCTNPCNFNATAQTMSNANQ